MGWLVLRLHAGEVPAIGQAATHPEKQHASEELLPVRAMSQKRCPGGIMSMAMMDVSSRRPPYARMMRWITLLGSTWVQGTLVRLRMQEVSGQALGYRACGFRDFGLRPPGQGRSAGPLCSAAPVAATAVLRFLMLSSFRQKLALNWSETGLGLDGKHLGYWRAGSNLLSLSSLTPCIGNWEPGTRSLPQELLG